MKIYANVCKLLSTNVAKTRSFRVLFLHGWSNIRTHCEYNILAKWLSYLEAYKYKGISWYGEKLIPCCSNINNLKYIIYVQISNKKVIV